MHRSAASTGWDGLYSRRGMRSTSRVVLYLSRRVSVSFTWSVRLPTPIELSGVSSFRCRMNGPARAAFSDVVRLSVGLLYRYRARARRPVYTGDGESNRPLTAGFQPYARRDEPVVTVSNRIRQLIM